jgi:hypothetical protein
MTCSLSVFNNTETSSIIEIANPDFEIPVLEDDTIINSADVTNPVTSWNIYDPTGLIARADTTSDNYADIGTWNPPFAAYPNGAAGGNNVAFTYIPTASGEPNQVGEGFTGISQTLDTVVTDNFFPFKRLSLFQLLVYYNQSSGLSNLICERAEINLK